MSVAIIGGGLTGCLIALELAEAGRTVVLFEKEAGLLTRASLSNEGKIHLGFVYAGDSSFRTAKCMIDDALRFRPVLERWIASQSFEAMVYDKFDYLIPQDSMLSVESIEAHFERVAGYLKERTSDGAASYLGQKHISPIVRSAPNCDSLQARFHTPEQGVWPALVADHIVHCVTSHPRIEVRLETTIAKLRSENNRWFIEMADPDPADDGPFETIVNCAWAGRRRIDAASGFPDRQQWFYRYKFGVILSNASAALGEDIPRNSTAMLGTYGDSVYHASQDILYCSWYPVGMCFSTDDLTQDRPPQLADKASAILNSWKGYAALDPAFNKLVEGRPLADAKIAGDYIAAKAKTDIQDPQSRLHERHSYGAMELASGYWSVETGKYTSAPRCADECARAILGRP